MEEKQKYRKITFFKNYFLSFFDKQPLKVQRKISWTFDLIEELQVIPEPYFKSIRRSNGLFEIRVQVESDIYRIFCFFNKGKLIILANGFQKKTQKTPRSEIKRALLIKAEYEREQQQSDDSRRVQR